MSHTISQTNCSVQDLQRGRISRRLDLRYSRRDLAARFTIGLREARECRYWLRLIRADQPKLAPQIDVLLEEYGQLVAVLSTSVRKLRMPTGVVVVLIAIAAASVSCLLS